MLRLAYQEEPLTAPPPPSLSSDATTRWRPLIAVHIIGPTGRTRYFPRALLDPGSDDTVFPLDIAGLIGANLMADTSSRSSLARAAIPITFRPSRTGTVRRRIDVTLDSRRILSCSDSLSASGKRGVLAVSRRDHSFAGPLQHRLHSLMFQRW